jgi:hypothetical protein
MTEWSETYPQYMPEGQAFVAISDGTCTHCAYGDDIDALIADYVSTYSFNSPGEVRCTAGRYPSDWNGEDAPAEERSFTIDSENGLVG